LDLDPNLDADLDVSLDLEVDLSLDLDWHLRLDMDLGVSLDMDRISTEIIIFHTEICDSAERLEKLYASVVV
jgi:hypothetical protein